MMIEHSSKNTFLLVLYTRPISPCVVLLGSHGCFFDAYCPRRYKARINDDLIKRYKQNGISNKGEYSKSCMIYNVSYGLYSI